MAGSALRKSTGLRRTASAGSVGKSKGVTSNKGHYPSYSLCIENRGYEGSLIVGKVYRVMKPEPADRPGDLRVVDEEGEDYLYPAERFVPVELPPRARRVLGGSR